MAKSQPPQTPLIEIQTFLVSVMKLKEPPSCDGSSHVPNFCDKEQNDGKASTAPDSYGTSGTARSIEEEWVALSLYYDYLASSVHSDEVPAWTERLKECFSEENSLLETSSDGHSDSE